MSLNTLSPQKHIVKDTPIARAFRKRLGFEDMITFFNVETRQWVLAYWVNKKAHLVDEMEDLGPNFEEATPEVFNMICKCWKPVNWRAKKQKLLEKERAQKQKNDEILEEQGDLYNWLKRVTGEALPVQFGSFKQSG